MRPRSADNQGESEHGTEGDDPSVDSGDDERGGPSAGRVNRRAWTQAEHDAMCRSVSEQLKRIQDQQDGDSCGGEGTARGINWSEVAVAVPGRSGKQCRERWFNR